MWRRLVKDDEPLALQFLRPLIEESFLFMYVNLLKAGVNYEGAMNQAEYFGSFDDNGQLNALLSHCWNSNILFHSVPEAGDVLRFFDVSLIPRQVGLIFAGGPIESLIQRLPTKFGTRLEHVFKLDLTKFETPFPFELNCLLADSGHIEHLGRMRANFESEGLFVPISDTLIQKCTQYIRSAVEHKHLYISYDANHVPIAMCSVTDTAENTVQISGVYASPEARGQGWAKRVVAFALHDQKLKGMQLSILFTQNPRAIKVYCDLGYTIWGAITLAYPLQDYESPPQAAKPHQQE